jgi:hypothetical protein
MDGNSAKKAPILDNLVGTSNTPIGNKPTLSRPTQAQTLTQAKPAVTSMNGNGASASNAQAIQNTATQAEKSPQNRRTDKSEFEIELTKTVREIMLKHFEHASEQIVQQVLSEVRARLPGQRKS